MRPSSVPGSAPPSRSCSAVRSRSSSCRSVGESGSSSAEAGPRSPAGSKRWRSARPSATSARRRRVERRGRSTCPSATRNRTLPTGAAMLTAHRSPVSRWHHSSSTRTRSSTSNASAAASCAPASPSIAPTSRTPSALQTLTSVAASSTPGSSRTWLPGAKRSDCSASLKPSEPTGSTTTPNAASNGSSSASPNPSPTRSA
jgi:hypothetical protein